MADLVGAFAAVLLIVVVAMIVAAAVTLSGHPRRAVPPYLRGGDTKN